MIPPANPSSSPATPGPGSRETTFFRLTEKLVRTEAVARVLNEFATSLVRAENEEDILWEVTNRCIASLGFEDCVVYLADPRRRVLVQKAAYGPKNPRGREILSPLEIPVGRGIVGAVAASGTGEIIADTRKDPRYIVDDRARLSELAVPILAGDQVLGVIDSEHSQPDFFTPDHLTILTAIGSICANKLERVRAEAQLRELNNQLEERVRERTAELAATNARLQQEVSERRRAEAALRESTQRLRESEERFRKAFRAIPAHVSIARASDLRFIEANEVMLQNSGYTKTEFIGRTSVELGLWAELSERDEFVERLKRDGFVHSMEARFRSKDGRIDIGLVSAEMIEIDGEPCVLALSLSITDRKQAEEELRRALVRERELSRLRSAFVSLVSHEFRTPLGVIHSSAEILERYLDQLPHSERLRHVRAIQSHAMRMASLMEGVLVFGKAEAGRLEFKPNPFNLADAAARWTEEQLLATDHRCPVALHLGPLPDARGDAELLRHVVSNLLSNAIKYSPPGATVEFHVTRDGADGVLLVRDHGVGIPAADRERLFTAFQRGANVSQVPGTGLGLVVIKHCLDLHKGRIQIDSAENAGTTVTVRVPLFPPTP